MTSTKHRRVVFRPGIARPGSRAAAILAAMSLAACSGSPRTPAGTGAWDGTVASRDGVTTVTTTSGSVWGGTATLIEEASIGSEHEGDAYLLGGVGGLWADGERIYVVDYQTPAVRAYDRSGEFLFDIGRRGQGPGEYEEPWGVATRPNGEIVVSEVAGGRLNTYRPDGTPSQTVPATGGWRIMMTNMFVMTGAGVPYTMTFDALSLAPSGFPRLGMQPTAPDGTRGETTFAPSLGFEPWCLEVSYTTQPFCLVPFAPSEMSAFTPEAAWVVGASDTYSFQLHGADGGVMEIEKYWDPVPVAPEEADYERRRVEARIRASEPDWVWKGPDVPSTKPAYRRFYPDHSGRIWVLRDGPSARVPGCDLEASIADRRAPVCFEPEPILDAFGPDGRYLGSVALPPHVVLTRDMFIRDDLVLLPAIDDAGTPMVKRYRLVMPAG